MVHQEAHQVVFDFMTEGSAQHQIGYHMIVCGTDSVRSESYSRGIAVGRVKSIGVVMLEAADHKRAWAAELKDLTGRKLALTGRCQHSR
ncbi:hypothetical protein [Duncaniella muris]|uniref:hypothetical protein n=1 Tax=Duncaniella muris TaxID=2094150 RepID=UPI00336BCD51